MVRYLAPGTTDRTRDARVRKVAATPILPLDSGGVGGPILIKGAAGLPVVLDQILQGWPREGAAMPATGTAPTDTAALARVTNGPDGVARGVCRSDKTPHCD